MVKIVVGSLKESKAGKVNVTTKRVKGADGKTATLYTVDSDSPTFVQDLSYVFKKNVAKARRANRRRQGSVVVPRLSVEPPRFWIVAGPNGSGKSTLYDATDIEGFGRSVWIINPDLLAARIRDRND